LRKAGATGSAGDETGDVGQHEARIDVDGDHAQVRHQRGERVLGDRRTRSGHRANERAFSHVRKAQEPRVGHDFELETKMLVFSRLAGLGPPRSAIE
jgi:hypothetical protein